MAKKEHWLAGWTRISEDEFKAAVSETLKGNPRFLAQIKEAIIASALRTGVPREIRERCLRWLDEAAQA